MSDGIVGLLFVLVDAVQTCCCSFTSFSRHINLIHTTFECHSKKKKKKVLHTNEDASSQLRTYTYQLCVNFCLPVDDEN